MPESFSFRRAGVSDLGVILDLRLDFERITRDSGSMDKEGRRTEIAALLGPDLEKGTLISWLAESGAGRQVAQIALRLFSEGRGEILNVYTDPSFREKGIGSVLVGLAVAEARALGLERISLHPTDISRRIYERAGFYAAGNEMFLDLAYKRESRETDEDPIS